MERQGAGQTVVGTEVVSFVLFRVIGEHLK